VQIKLTGGDQVAVAASTDHPTRLVVLKLDRKKGFEEVYNGVFPMELVQRKKARRGTITLTVRELGEGKRRLHKNLHSLPEINSLRDLNDRFPKNVHRIPRGLRVQLPRGRVRA
jgi:hypothetical protein